MVDCGLVELAPLGLEVGAFVPIQAEPPHGPLDALGVLGPVALKRRCPRSAKCTYRPAGGRTANCKGRCRAADVEIPRRRRRHADTNSTHKARTALIVVKLAPARQNCGAGTSSGYCGRCSISRAPGFEDGRKPPTADSRRGDVSALSEAAQLASRSRASLPASARRSLVSASRSMRLTRSAVRSSSSPTSPWVRGSPRSRP